MLRKKLLLSFLIALSFIFNAPFSLNAQGLTSDTTFATGWFDVMRTTDNHMISTLLDVTLIPLNVQMVNPDTIFDNMSGSGNYAFNLPVYIDTTIGLGIEDSKTLETKLINTGGAELGILLNSFCNKGRIELYSIDGRLLKSGSFTGNSAYIRYPELANGIYIYRLVADGQFLAGKVMKACGEVGGLALPPSLNIGRLGQREAKGYSADYRIMISDPNRGPGTGYLPLDTVLSFVDGNNGTVNLWMDPVPALTVDLRFHLWSIDGDSLPNAFVYIKDSQGNIDSLRTDSNGVACFVDLPQNKSFSCGVGGVANLKFWEGFNITIPSASSYADTVWDKNYTLFPDSTFSGLNDTVVELTRADLGNIFETFNIELALDDTIRIYISSTFGAVQQANLNKWADSLMAWTGINIFKSASQYNTNLSAYNPFTVNHSTVGTNVLPGTSNTMPNNYIMSTTGQFVIINANMTTGAWGGWDFFKEMGRLLALGEVTNRNSVMNPVPKPIDDKDVASYTLMYKMGKAVYRYHKQDLSHMLYLKDSSLIIPDY